ncbi:hypothetical protein EJ06DRAFT_567809 [Trichodelitschia bisporula]|uniref:alpha-galactosidase n=1 Tax=Trichodelitschia bisporula TaxID=703511 RepID=A0A6G1HM74_9PEZI|nr:hypothetical protein EJ06DRAFT_567809 [Trichodelitschia bisporula]
MLSSLLVFPLLASAAVWQPPVGAKFQIILRNSIIDASSPLAPSNIDVLDLDLFDTPKSLITKLHGQGKRVVCYFSAGGAETWRPDYGRLNASVLGDEIRGWRGERWLDIRSEGVWEVMRGRVGMAAEKGCDGVDPDNIDAFGDEARRGGGFGLTKQDSIAFVKRLAAEAHRLDLAIGLKNAEAILPSVRGDVQFAVNEECATYGCSAYESFVKEKPVFHIEYASHTVNGTDSRRGRVRMMSKEAAQRISTVIKNMDLGGWVMYCDGSWGVTKTRGGGRG